MTEKDNLSDDFETFREDLLREAEATGDPQQAAFFSMFAALAAENGDTADLSYRPVLREGARPFQVDGYAWDEDRGELHLAVCDYHARSDLETINADRVTQLFNRVRRFCELAVDRDFVQSLEETSPAFDLGSLIYGIQKQLHRVRCVLFSNARLATRKKTLNADDVIGVAMTYDIIDFSRYVEIQNAQGGTEPIELDVAELNEGKLLSCLDAHDGDETVKSYLIVMPGSLLVKIYGLHGAKLMEQNVRTFLQARTKTNQGIIDTARNSPGMFFAYNNGITATASGVDLVKDSNGIQGIEKIQNLQIVNGGQTTASLLYASDRGTADLSRIFVQMKLSVIDPARLDEVVPKISRYANTQNRISEADFFSNHQFHVEMQKISRRLAAPRKTGSLATTKWFYERARGQYRNETSRKSVADKNRFQTEYPRNQVFQKTDLAKYQLSFRPEPHTVSLGAQKCFLSFAQEIGRKWEASDTSRASFNDNYFKELVAKAIIFRELDRDIGRAEWYKEDRGYKANIVTYTIGWLVERLNKQSRRIDFELIWNRQEMPEELHRALTSLAPQIADLLKSPPEGISNISEYAKRIACWKRISEKNLDYDDEVLRSTISFEEAKQHDKDSKAEGKIDLEIMFDQLIVNNMQKIISLLPFLSSKGLLSPKSAAAIQKLDRGNINLTKSEKNALKHILKRLDDEYEAGPKNWE
jgi:hypothetical protein